MTALAATLEYNRPVENTITLESVFLQDVLIGLSQHQKMLPSKYFYDAQGSKLFDEITELDEYYLTRLESQIMRESIHEIAGLFNEGDFLIEFGSGNSSKTRMILDNVDCLSGYVPVDISEVHLVQTAIEMRQQYPNLAILPVAGDYTLPFDLPDAIEKGDRRIVYFPGSTIGNFDPDEAKEFMARIRAFCGRSGALLIGVDLRKDVLVLDRAYNDRHGVTAKFNLNILARINRELSANFDLEHGFAHYAFYNPMVGRIEMHLISRRAQVVEIAHHRVSFMEGETIFTESSYKHTLPLFSKMAEEAGFQVAKVWTDPQNWFSIQYLTAK